MIEALRALSRRPDEAQDPLGLEAPGGTALRGGGQWDGMGALNLEWNILRSTALFYVMIIDNMVPNFLFLQVFDSDHYFSSHNRRTVLDYVG